MITELGCRARRDRLWQQVDADLEWIVVTDPRHLTYFSGFAPSPFVFNTQGASGILILGRNGSAILVADNVQEPYINAAFVTERVMPVWYCCVEAAGPRTDFLVKAAIERMAQCNGAVVGYESSSCPAAFVDALRAVRSTVKLKDVTAVVHALRRAKDSDEVELIKTALRAATAGLQAAMREVRPGMSELDIYRLVERVAGETAGRQILIYGDFVSGERCEKGGGVPSNRLVRSGELVLLDFSAVIDGYRGDFCNTFVCDGQASSKQREMFDACYAAMQAGESELRPGAECRRIFEAVQKQIASRGMGAYFSHHAGHGIGLGHPEPPFFVPKSEERLVVGDVVTLEPGVYIPGIGGMRFERDYMITDGGFESLSDHPISIDASA